jgi:zinc D-Ala-D-Ala carboxypeptidase
MSHSERARTAGRGTRSTILAALIVVSAVLIGVLGYPSSLVVRSSSATSPVTIEPPAQRPPGGLPRVRHDADGLDDGVVPDGVTVDDEYPAVANLDAALLRALRRAAGEAAGDGIGFLVNSGWRSPEYQEQLLDEAVAEYGSAEEAARWVATAEASVHVSGDAVDIGPFDATAWLSEHGSEYGLCQIYGNEPWHYELRPEAMDQGCPTLYVDPTHDPRMQR